MMNSDQTLGAFDNLSEDEIQKRLCSQPSKAGEHLREPGINLPQEMKYRNAAVLIPLLCIQNAWHLLLTERTEQVQDHKGQVAFPGGAVEPEDADRTATALRETWEEIGLPPKEVKVLGFLPDLPTVSGFMITPVVGVIPWPYPFQLSTSEVKRVFTVPLEWAASSSNREERSFVGFDHQHRTALFYREYDGATLWGISARITVLLTNILQGIE